MNNKYESEIKTLQTSAQKSFELLSNLSNIEKILATKDNTEWSKQLENITFDNDSVRINADMAGTVTFRIIEKEPHKTIKFQTENAPILANLWIQLVEKNSDDTKMKLTIHAEIPTMLKMMVSGKIKSSINKLADGIALAINQLNRQENNNIA